MKDRLKNNLGLKIMAILFATLLWLFVVNEENPVKTRNFVVPIEITHPEVVTTTGKSFQILEDTRKVVVTVEAKRAVSEKIKSEDVRAVADLREMQLAGDAIYSVPVRVSVSGHEYVEAYANPRNIQIKTEDNEKKTFPITPKASGTLAENYSIGELKVEPQSIEVSGPRSSIGRISKVIAKVDVSNLSRDTSLPAELVFYDSADNVIDQSVLTHKYEKNSVYVKVHVLEKKKVEVRFDTSEITTESGYTFTGITVEPQNIVVLGTKEKLDSLTYIQVGSEALRLHDISKKTEIVVDVEKYLPEGIVLASDESKNIVVNVSVEKNGMKTIQIPVISLKINNLPENMEVSYGSEQEVELQFEGMDEALEILTKEKIAASIDLRTYVEEGTYDVPVLVADLPKGIQMIEGTTIQIILKKK